MMLISLCEHPGKEQRHGVINAGETARRERGCSEVPPCPEEGERSHAAGVLCHHGVQSSLCSLPAPEVCEARDPGSSDPSPNQALLTPRRPASRRATSFSNHDHVTLERLVSCQLTKCTRTVR